MRRVVLCVCLLSLFVGNTAYAHSPGGLTIQSFPLPDVKPVSPIFRGDQLWFSPDIALNALLYLVNGKTMTVQLPSVFDGGGFLLTSNPDGGMWATTGYTGDPQLFLHLTAKNQMSFYSLEGESASSSAGGDDGSLWYTGDGSSISKISPSGVVTHFQVGYPYRRTTAQIVRASDGSFWSSGGSDVTHITPQGKWSTFLLPDYSGSPQQLIALPDGRIWILAVDPNANNPTAHIVIMGEKGKTQSYTFDQPANVMDANNISHYYAKGYITVLAHDGTLWFLDYRHRQLVHSTLYGHVIKLYSFPELIGSITGLPGMLTMGPDGALWLTEPDAHQIVRITLP